MHLYQGSRDGVAVKTSLLRQREIGYLPDSIHEWCRYKDSTVVKRHQDSEVESRHPLSLPTPWEPSPTKMSQNPPCYGFWVTVDNDGTMSLIKAQREQVWEEETRS